VVVLLVEPAPHTSNLHHLPPRMSSATSHSPSTAWSWNALRLIRPADSSCGSRAQVGRVLSGTSALVRPRFRSRLVRLAANVRGYAQRPCAGALSRGRALCIAVVRRWRSFFSSTINRIIVLYWVNKDLSSDGARYYSDWVRRYPKRPFRKGNDTGASRALLGVVAGSMVLVRRKEETKRPVEEIAAEIRSLLESLGPSSNSAPGTSSQPHYR